MLFELWTDVLPNALSVRIGHNTEGYILARAIAAWIQFVRPRITVSRAEWIITAIAALAFVALTIYLLAGHGVASRFKTLNEGAWPPRCSSAWVAPATVSARCRCRGARDRRGNHCDEQVGRDHRHGRDVRDDHSRNHRTIRKL